MDAFECKTKLGVAIGIERDDSNVFDESPSAIVMHVGAVTPFSEDEIVFAGPGYIRVDGKAELEIDAVMTMDEARALHEALGQQIAATP